MSEIFVFGSNLAGIHGRGSALQARKFYGAELGVGIGRTGNAYATPTKNKFLQILPIAIIKSYINDFLSYAELHPDLSFTIVKIGCGLAGYREDLIRPLFIKAPGNCTLPDGWREEKPLN